MTIYNVGLQLETDFPEYMIEIEAKDSDIAWSAAVQIYQDKGFTEHALKYMVLWQKDQQTTKNT